MNRLLAPLLARAIAPLLARALATRSRVYAQRELEALLSHDALRADRLRLRLARFSHVPPFGDRRRKEQRRLGASARGPEMPGFMNDAERQALLHPRGTLNDAERIPGGGTRQTG